MKALQTRIYLVQVLLLMMAASLVVLGFLFPHEDITFWPATFGYLVQGQDKYPLVIGVMGITPFTQFLGFLLLYLSFEFYGLKPALYAVLSLALVMAALYFLLGFLARASIDPRTAPIDRRILMFFTPSHREFVATLCAFLFGQSLTFILAAGLKKLTQNYFMFFRYTIAALIGLLSAAALHTALQLETASSWEDFAIVSATPAAQAATLVILSVVPLYLLRLFLGIFRGRPKKDDPKTPEQQVPEAAPSTFGKVFKGLIFYPTFFGSITALILRLGIEACIRDLFPNAPLFIIDGTEHPNDYAIHYGIVVAVTLVILRTLFWIGTFVFSRRSRKNESGETSTPSLFVKEEDTVSEKINPFHKPA